MTTNNFYVVTFVDAFGDHQVSRSFVRIKNARRWAASLGTWARNVRIMMGGPGGVDVY